jgi:hypothetical protein
MKVAKIITTSFIPRVIREKSELCGNPLGFFSHSQNFPSKESVVDLLKFVISREEECDPGCSTDLIIVNNDTGWQRGVEYLDSIDQVKLKRGVIRVFHRENSGRSFGGYNFAFSKLKDEYDYFIFTEDDIVISVDGYASTGIEIFNKTINCGFVAYEGVSNKSKFNLSKEDTMSAHGGVGLSSVKVLSYILDKYGSLPYAKKESSQEYEDIIKNGEIAFTNKIHKAGFQLVSMPKNTKLYSFAYDMMNGISVKRYPSLLEIIIHKGKIILYRIPIIRGIHRLCKTTLSKA